MTQTIDRRQMLKGAGAIGVGALAALVPTTTIAKAEGDIHGIEGSWLVTVTVLGPGPPPFQSLWSFTSGGVFIATDAIDKLPQFSASPEHGAWAKKRDREISVAAMKFLFDSSGSFIGTFKARGVMELDEASDAFSGSAKVQAFDPTGKLLFSASVALRATRIRA